MKITIITPFSQNTVESTDLLPHEQSLLKALAIPKELREEALAPLAFLPPMKKLSTWSLCPNGAPGHAQTRVTVTTEGAPGDAQLTKDIAPFYPEGIVLDFKRHIMKGFCEKCRQWHEISNRSVMVQIKHQGVQVQKRYAVTP